MGEMISSLKAFMKSYKISANLNSKRLSAGAIELPPEFGVGAKELKNLYGPDAVDGLTKSFDQSMKMLNDLEQGLKGNGPRPAKRLSRSHTSSSSWVTTPSSWLRTLVTSGRWVPRSA